MFILLTNKTTHDLRKIYEINVLVNINVGEKIYYSQFTYTLFWNIHLML